MSRQFKLFLAEASASLPARWRARLLDFAAFFFFKILRPARRLIPLHILRHLHVSSEVLGPPKDLCETTEDCCRSLGLEKAYFPIHPPGQYDRPPLPATLEPMMHEAFLREHDQLAPRTFVAEIPGARVYGDCGAVISPDDRLVLDVSGEMTMPRFEHSIFFRFRLPRAVRLPGKSTVLATAGRANYSHWMCDSLPRLELLRKAGFRWEDIDHFLVGEFTPFQKETLELLGIDPARRRLCTPSSHFRCETLIVSSLPGMIGHPPPWAGDFLREMLLGTSQGAAGALDARAGKRIYISRAGARFRRVLNEVEVIATLQREGFTVVKLETLSVAAQARLFSEAEVVVSPHGAGLTNILFCQPGAVVVEIFSPRCVIPAYYGMASRGHLRYGYVLGRPLTANSKGHYFSMIEDISVDCQALLETLALRLSVSTDSASKRILASG